MAFARATDRVMQFSDSVGLSTILLNASVTGYQDFLDAVTPDDFISYCIYAVDANGVPTGLWEVGHGQFRIVASEQVTRGTGGLNSIWDGSSGPGVMVDFGNSRAYVFITDPGLFTIQPTSDFGAIYYSKQIGSSSVANPVSDQSLLFDDSQVALQVGSFVSIRGGPAAEITVPTSGGSLKVGTKGSLGTSGIENTWIWVSNNGNVGIGGVDPTAETQLISIGVFSVKDDPLSNDFAALEVEPLVGSVYLTARDGETIVLGTKPTNISPTSTKIFSTDANQTFSYNEKLIVQPDSENSNHFISLYRDTGSAAEASGGIVGDKVRPLVITQESSPYNTVTDPTFNMHLGRVGIGSTAGEVIDGRLNVTSLTGPVIGLLQNDKLDPFIEYDSLEASDGTEPIINVGGGGGVIRKWTKTTVGSEVLWTPHYSKPGSGDSAEFIVMNVRMSCDPVNPYLQVGESPLLYIHPVKGPTVWLYTTGFGYAPYMLKAPLTIGTVAQYNAWEVFDVYLYWNTITLEINAELVGWTNFFTPPPRTKWPGTDTEAVLLYKAGDQTRTYIGTCSIGPVSARVYDTKTHALIWNMYNRVVKNVGRLSPAGGTTYQATAWREAMSGDAYFYHVVGVSNHDRNFIDVGAWVNHGTGNAHNIGILHDSVTPVHDQTWRYSQSAGQAQVGASGSPSLAFIGRSKYSAGERCDNTASANTIDGNCYIYGKYHG